MSLSELKDFTEKNLLEREEERRVIKKQFNNLNFLYTFFETEAIIITMWIELGQFEISLLLLIQ